MKNYKLNGFWLSLFGIIGCIASIASIPNDYRMLKIGLIIASGILLVIGVLSWTGFYFTACFDCRKAGITKIGHFTPSHRAYRKIVRAKEVKVMAVSAQMLLLHARDMFEEALRNNVTFKFLLSSPESKIVENVELVEGSGRIGKVAREIESSISLINDYNNLHANGRICVQYIPDEMFRTVLIICDNKYGIATLNVPPRRSGEAYKIEMFNSEKGLLRDYIKYFDSCWELSKPIEQGQ